MRCDICNRRASFVGRTRGFDTARGVCGGCVDLSEDESDNDTVLRRRDLSGPLVYARQK